MNDENGALNGGGKTIASLSLRPYEETWAHEGAVGADEHLAPDSVVSLNLIGLPYIGAALRRLAWLWCATAVLGMVIGAASFKMFPPSYAASTTILVTNNPQIDPVDAMDTNTAIAESVPVAALALKSLGMSESVSAFEKNVTVTSASDQLLQINVHAPSTSLAVERAGAMATAFLDFRATQLKEQQSAVTDGLNQQISQAQQRVSSLNKQITQTTGESASSQRDATLTKLQDEHTQAEEALTTLQQTAVGTEATAEATMQSMVRGTQVLNAAAPVTHSRLKLALVYVTAGFIAGLVLGMVIVLVRTLVSDKLRRRDDVAQALGAPVRLSVGSIRASRWRPARGASEIAGHGDVKRVAAYLGSALAGHAVSGPAATLAVVSIDNPDVAVAATIALARSQVREGKKVIVADLSRGARLADMLGAKGDGIHRVATDGGTLAVAVPDPDAVAPVGPLHSPRQWGAARVSEELAAAYASADVLCTLVDLDPSLSSEHLATWARDAVVLVTAGRSSAARIHGVGELLRLSGTRMNSAILIGADKSDESLGVDLPTSLAGAE